MSLNLKAEQVSVEFDSPAGRLRALGPVSVEIQAGQFVCVIGPSGCGKSTLVRLFAGLVPPTSGQIFIDGQPLTEPSPRVGLMFQQANLMPWRSVQENIELPLELAGVSRAERAGVAARLMHMLRLDEFAQSYPAALSGGMAQRTALGRVMAQGADVLLLDEPLGALDAMTREQVSADLMRVWQQARQTVLLVTHDLNEAVLLSDRVLVMSQRPGRILADIPVTLPRPRQPDLLYDPVFAEIAREVRASLERA